jgi:hypothetical protein
MAEIDVGICHEHERAYEGLCKTCNVIICPSCVMFGNHKKHDVLSLKQGAMYLRKAIDEQIFRGVFKKEFCETKMLKIKENRLLMEKAKAETIQKIEECFRGIIQALIARKNVLIQEILQKFDIEKQKIENADNDWGVKQDISEKLLDFFDEKNDSYILANSKFIMEGLRKLNEPISFNELDVYNNIDNSLIINTVNQNGEEENKEFAMEDLLEAFSEYITIGKPNLLQYKA